MGDFFKAAAYTEANVICIIILVIVMLNVINRSEKSMMYDQKLFVAIICLLIAILIFDSFTWLLDGETFQSAHTLAYISNFVYYIIQPVLCLLWLIYTDYKSFGDTKKLKKRLVYYCIPTVVFIILTIVSLFTGWFFYIDSANIYHRGDYMFVCIILTFVYLAAASIMSLTKAISAPTSLSRRQHIVMMCFIIPIIIGSAIQLSVQGLSTIWVSATISCIIIFITLQNAQINNDYLTGVFNRRYFEQTLATMLVGRDKNKLFSVILDIDDFKNINDKLGHLMGDDALISTADILSRACISTNCIVARFGGDEFVIVGSYVDEKEISDLLGVIEYDLTIFNERKKKPYLLSFSYGMATTGKDWVKTSDEFIKLADARMYKNKETKKKENVSAV